MIRYNFYFSSTITGKILSVYESEYPQIPYPKALKEDGIQMNMFLMYSDYILLAVSFAERHCMLQGFQNLKDAEQA